MDDVEIDFALVVHRSDGAWTVEELTLDHVDDVTTLARALRRFDGSGSDGGAVGLVAVGEDWFVIVRVSGSSTRVLLSDVTAVEEWHLAATVLELVGLPYPDQVGDEDEDDEEQVPVGDLGLLADLGLSAMDLGLLIDDVDLYPDELLSEVARVVGFGELFDEAVGLTSA